LSSSFAKCAEAIRTDVLSAELGSGMVTLAREARYRLQLSRHFKA